MPSASGGNFLESDPYQFTLDVAPPIMEADEYAEEPESMGEIPRPRALSVYQRPSPAQVQLELEDEDEEEGANEIRTKEIRPRQQNEEWDFTELGKDGFDLQACEYARVTYGRGKE